MVVLDDTGLGKKFVENYKTLGEESGAEFLKPEEFKRRFGGVYEDADLRGVEDVYFNPRSGWAEATNALRKVIEAAIERGVKNMVAEVERLLFDDQGACCGVRTTDGTEVHAGKVVMCTGAGTAKLLADSAPGKPELWVGDRVMAAGVCTAAIKLTEDQVRKYKDVPVLVHKLGHVLGLLSVVCHTVHF